MNVQHILEQFKLQQLIDQEVFQESVDVEESWGELTTKYNIPTSWLMYLKSNGFGIGDDSKIELKQTEHSLSTGKNADGSIRLPEEITKFADLAHKNIKTNSGKTGVLACYATVDNKPFVMILPEGKARQYKIMTTDVTKAGKPKIYPMGNSGGLTGEELKQKLLKEINVWTDEISKMSKTTKGTRIRSGSTNKNNDKIGSLHIYYILMNDERAKLQQYRADAKKGSVLDPNFGKRNVVSESVEVDTIQKKLESLCDEMLKIVKKNMPNKGNKCEDSQRICLINALNDVSSMINGISEEDFTE